MLESCRRGYVDFNMIQKAKKLKQGLSFPFIFAIYNMQICDTDTDSGNSFLMTIVELIRENPSKSCTIFCMFSIS